MTDVFLMGTSGSANDPKRSKWREPIKAVCKQLGLDCYDPTSITGNWDETVGRHEVALLQESKIVVMAITADTAGVGSLAESGWAALSALKRGQAFALYISPAFTDTQMGPIQRLGSRIDTLFGHKYDSLEASSRRARILTLGHAMTFAKEFPDVDFYIANDLDHLTSWVSNRLRKLQKA